MMMIRFTTNDVVDVIGKLEWNAALRPDGAPLLLLSPPPLRLMLDQGEVLEGASPCRVCQSTARKRETPLLHRVVAKGLVGLGRWDAPGTRKYVEWCGLPVGSLDRGLRG